jgi:hypothetical protein
MSASPQSSSKAEAAPAPAPAAFDAYMGAFTGVFGEELYRAHQSDADPEMTAALADCVEAGLMVWGNPLRLPVSVS